MTGNQAETLTFVLQCLESATQNGGRIDYAAIGAHHYNGATFNAMYLRLYRVKKSVNFTGPDNTKGTTIAGPNDTTITNSNSTPTKLKRPNITQSFGTATTQSSIPEDAYAVAVADGEAILNAHPYGPTAKLPAESTGPATKNKKQTAPKSTKVQKRKVEECEQDEAAAAAAESVGSTAVKNGKRAKKATAAAAAAATPTKMGTKKGKKAHVDDDDAAAGFDLQTARMKAMEEADAAVPVKAVAELSG